MRIALALGFQLGVLYKKTNTPWLVDKAVWLPPLLATGLSLIRSEELCLTGQLCLWKTECFCSKHKGVGSRKKIKVSKVSYFIGKKYVFSRLSEPQAKE